MIKMSNYRRFIPIASLIVSVVGLCGAWYFSYPYFLRWLEGYSFFSTLPDFTRVHYDLPADLIRYIGAFLLQFYRFPLAGALIQASLAVLMVGCIWGCVKRIFAEPESMMWLSFLPLPVFVHYQMSDLTLSRTLSWLACASAVLLVVVLLTIRKKGSVNQVKFFRNVLVSSLVSLVILASSMVVLIKGSDLTRGYEKVAYLEYSGEHQQWEKILQTVSPRDAKENEYQRRYVLLALLATGHLADGAFAYGLSSADDFLFTNVQEPFCLGFNTIFYKTLGMYNPAVYNTYQRAVQSAPGVSFNTLRFLADSYLATGDYTLAKKYIDILSHSTCHGKWVKQRLVRLQQLKGKAPVYPQAGQLFYLESFLADISSMYDRYPSDRRFADLLLCGFLAEKDGMTFYNIFQIVAGALYPDGRNIPRLYQEALLLTASRYPSILDRYAIDESVWKDFSDFTQMMQEGKTAQAKRKYTGTYWAYVY